MAQQPAAYQQAQFTGGPGMNVAGSSAGGRLDNGPTAQGYNGGVQSKYALYLRL